MSELSSVMRDLEAHQRQADLRQRARRERDGVATDRERGRLFRKVTRHTS